MPDRRPEDAPPGAPSTNRDPLTDAALDAEQELSRLEDIVEDTIVPGGDAQQGLDELVAEIDTGKASGELRDALGMDRKGSRRSTANPRRFKRSPRG